MCGTKSVSAQDEEDEDKRREKREKREKENNKLPLLLQNSYNKWLHTHHY